MRKALASKTVIQQKNGDAAHAKPAEWNFHLENPSPFLLPPSKSCLQSPRSQAQKGQGGHHRVTSALHELAEPLYASAIEWPSFHPLDRLDLFGLYII